MSKFEAKKPVEGAYIIDEEYGYKMFVWIPPKGFDVDAHRPQYYSALDTSGMPGKKFPVISESWIDEEGKEWHSDNKFKCTKASYGKRKTMVIYVETRKGVVEAFNVGDFPRPVLVDFDF